MRLYTTKFRSHMYTVNTNRRKSLQTITSYNNSIINSIITNKSTQAEGNLDMICCVGVSLNHMAISLDAGQHSVLLFVTLSRFGLGRLSFLALSTRTTAAILLTIHLGGHDFIHNNIHRKTIPNCLLEPFYKFRHIFLQ